MVTFSDLIQIGILVIGMIELVLHLGTSVNKKEVTAYSLPSSRLLL